MKKTCNGCKAYNSYGCALKYKTAKVFTGVTGTPKMVSMKPVENCPKPMTYKCFLSLIN